MISQFEIRSITLAHDTYKCGLREQAYPWEIRNGEKDGEKEEFAGFYQA